MDKRWEKKVLKAFEQAKASFLEKHSGFMSALDDAERKIFEEGCQDLIKHAVTEPRRFDELELPHGINGMFYAALLPIVQERKRQMEIEERQRAIDERQRAIDEAVQRAVEQRNAEFSVMLEKMAKALSQQQWQLPQAQTTPAEPPTEDRESATEGESKDAPKPKAKYKSKYAGQTWYCFTVNDPPTEVIYNEKPYQINYQALWNVIDKVIGAAIDYIQGKSDQFDLSTSEYNAADRGPSRGLLKELVHRQTLEEVGRLGRRRETYTGKATLSDAARRVLDAKKN